MFENNNRKYRYQMTFIWLANIIMMASLIGTISASISSSSSSSSEMDDQPQRSSSSSIRNSNYRLRLLQQSSSPTTTTSTTNLFSNQQQKHHPQQQQLIDDQFFNNIKDRLFMLQPIMLIHGGGKGIGGNFDDNGNGYISRKRSCLINAGLSNNCDFRDFISASNARRIWESQASPGKKRNSESSTTYRFLPINNRLLSSLSNNPSSSLSYNTWFSEQQQQQQPSSKLLIDNDDLIKNIEVPHRITSSSSINGNGNQERPLVNNDRLIIKRMECISGLPGGDCENSFLGGESLGQDFLRPGGRNPGK
uniref:Uncharacterized protein LOC113794991 n=1 Tax=Dermatophagoides pteronyssinus TaxID=6956 RepID=A0A6P6Y6C3_DERPT|nr:uncharacterized protein LOC113794991 [Dermatophagoides pteronyssinus]